MHKYLVCKFLCAEIAELDAMKEAYSYEPSCIRRILLLSEYLVGITDTCCTEQQRAATTSRVIDIAQTSVTDGYDLG